MDNNETLVPGDYTALINLNIRKQMETQSLSNHVGVYTKGVPFTVWEVYPERNGIVWGRVSSNTGNTGESRYVGLRVGNSIKAHLEKPFETHDNPTETSLLIRSINALTEAVWALVRKQ